MTRSPSTDSTNAAIRPGNIEKFTITNSDGKSLDITGAVSEFFFYESVLSNNISATVLIVDTGHLQDNKGKAQVFDGIIQTLNLKGGERVDFRINDAKNDNEVGKIEIKEGMYINRIRDVSNSTLKDIFALDLVPKEYFSNEKTRVTGRYDGKISDHVDTIVKKVLRSTLPLQVDSTSINYNFIGNDRKPFYVCTLLASKSVPENTDDGGTAGFLFYQTKKSFQFRSVDKLLEQQPTKKYIYNNTNVDSYQADDSIKTFTFNRTVDIGKEMAIGSYNNRSIFFDPIAMNYKVQEYNFEDQDASSPGRERNIPDVEDVTNSPTRLMCHILDIGTLPSGVNSDDELKTWKSDPSNPTFNAPKIMVQSIMRYNQLFSVQLNVVIPGDFSISAGDTVECKFFGLNSESNEEDKQLSGIYMVASICHKMTSNDTFTSLDLVGDSLGKTSQRAKAKLLSGL